MNNITNEVHLVRRGTGVISKGIAEVIKNIFGINLDQVKTEPRPMGLFNSKNSNGLANLMTKLNAVSEKSVITCVIVNEFTKEAMERAIRTRKALIVLSSYGGDVWKAKFHNTNMMTVNKILVTSCSAD